MPDQMQVSKRNLELNVNLVIVSLVIQLRLVLFFDRHKNIVV